MSQGEIVGAEKVAAMREIGRSPSPVSIEEVQAAVDALRGPNLA